MSKDERRINQLRKELRGVKSRRAACKGDPEMLRDLDDEARRLQTEIRQLGG